MDCEVARRDIDRVVGVIYNGDDVTLNCGHYQLHSILKCDKKKCHETHIKACRACHDYFVSKVSSLVKFVIAAEETVRNPQRSGKRPCNN